MDVFELCDDLGFGLEAADEIRVVGVFGEDDLYGYFSAWLQLHGAIHSPKCALADGGQQFIAFDFLTDKVVDIALPVTSDRSKLL
jgi:hypothetical protein